MSLVLSAALVLGALALTGIGQVTERLKSVDPSWLGAAFAVYAVQLALLGFRWSRVSSALGIDQRFWRATSEYSLSLLGNQALPGGFVGDGMRGLRLTERARSSPWLAFEAVAVDRASGQLALWLTVLVGAPLGVRAGLIPGRVLLLLLLGATLAGTLVWWLAFRLPSLDAHVARLRSFLRRTAFILFARRSIEHLVPSLLLVGCNVLQLYIAGRSLGVALPWVELAWLGPLVLVAASLPSFFGGWGIREGVSALLFASAGFPSSTGVAVSLIFGAFALASALPAIAVLFLEGSMSVRSLRNRRQHVFPLGWGNLHGLAMLSSTGVALALHWPVLPTCTGIFSLMVLVARSRGAWTDNGAFGSANAITTLRLWMALSLTTAPGHWPGHWVAIAALLILLLDLVDGWLARRYSGAGPFGARYDMEVDAVFVLSLSCALWSRGIGDVWVVLTGLWRYLFVVVPLIVPSRGGEAPRSLIYRSAYAVMVCCFLLALVVPAELGNALALLGTTVLSVSFLRSFWYRYVPAVEAQPKP